MSKPLRLSALTSADAKRLMRDLRVAKSTATGVQYVNCYKEWADDLFVPIGYDTSWLSEAATKYDPGTMSKHTFTLQEELFSGAAQRAQGVEEGKIKDQQEIYAEALGMLDSNSVVALALSTGIGKTKLTVHLSASYGERVLVICANKEVLRRSWEPEFLATGVTVSWVGTDGFIGPSVVHVCTVDNAKYLTPESTKDIGTVVYDEAHLWTESCLRQGLVNVRPNRLLLLSATLERLDGLEAGLELFYGKNKIERILKKDFTLHKCVTGIRPDTSKRVKINGQSRINYSHAMSSINSQPAWPPMLAALCEHSVRSVGMTIAFFTSKSLLRAVSALIKEPHFDLLEDGKLSLNEEKLVLAIDKKAKEGVDIPGLRSVVLTYSGNDIKQPEGRVRDDFFDLWIVVHDNPMFEKHFGKAEAWAAQRSRGAYISHTLDLRTL